MARAGACIAATLALVFAPGGAAIAVLGTFRIDVETGAQLSPAGVVPWAGATGLASPYSPDGSEVLSWRSQALVATDLATKTSREIARPAQRIATASWSPDGNTIAFSLNERPVTGCPQPTGASCGQGQIWIVRSDGSGLRKFSDDAVRPAWSPDSRRLAFLGSFDTHAQTGVVTVADVDGSGRRALSGRGAGSGPEWSADGRFIAYTSTDLRGYHERVRIVRLSGDKHTQTLGASRFLAWSPHGSTLAYVHYLPGATGLFVTDPVAGQSRRLVASPRSMRPGRLTAACWRTKTRGNVASARGSSS